MAESDRFERSTEERRVFQVLAFVYREKISELVVDHNQAL